jgi:hypothetical protein
LVSGTNFTVTTIFTWGKTSKNARNPADSREEPGFFGAGPEANLPPRGKTSNRAVERAYA